MKAFEIITNSGKKFEIRTTLDSRLSKEDLFEMDKFLQDNNIEKWYLQRLMLKEGFFEILDFELTNFKTKTIIR